MSKRPMNEIATRNVDNFHERRSLVMKCLFENMESKHIVVAVGIITVTVAGTAITLSLCGKQLHFRYGKLVASIV